MADSHSEGVILTFSSELSFIILRLRASPTAVSCSVPSAVLKVQCHIEAAVLATTKMSFLLSPVSLMMICLFARLYRPKNLQFSQFEQGSMGNVPLYCQPTKLHRKTLIRPDGWMTPKTALKHWLPKGRGKLKHAFLPLKRQFSIHFGSWEDSITQFCSPKGS